MLLQITTPPSGRSQPLGSAANIIMPADVVDSLTTDLFFDAVEPNYPNFSVSWVLSFLTYVLTLGM